VYLPESASHLRDRLLSRLVGLSVMSVSDVEDFAVNGGVVELAIIDGTLKFKLNREAARRANLKPSSGVLRLGIIVEERHAPEPEREPSEAP
jgi:hypothetical protein